MSGERKFRITQDQAEMLPPDLDYMALHEALEQAMKELEEEDGLCDRGVALRRLMERVAEITAFSPETGRVGFLKFFSEGL